jgi:hypothetical protein
MLSDDLRRLVFIETLKANVDNEALSDRQFREMVKEHFQNSSSPLNPPQSDHFGPYGYGTPFGQ